MAENKDNFHEIRELDPDQLDGISGGSCRELSEDSKVLRSLGLCDRFYDQSDLMNSPRQCQEVVAAWKKGGVTVRTSKLYPNQYIIDGNKVTRLIAIDHVKKNS